ncbi:TIGR03089 family protein [Arthrobacter sp. NPDC090010]|uniref:TIGR03089 family protein n=1 Tax=Arthrobacter sp. NPDC090010 TaxID=3363942 RepID=UPI0037F18AF0
MNSALRNLTRDFREGLTLPAGAPRLTWYGPGGERVELSGKVLDNWIAKSANLLQDELDGAPGGSIALALPGHWKTLILAVAAMRLGMTVHPVQDAVADSLSETDMTATADAGLLGQADSIDTQLIAVALEALALRWSTPLPSGVLDYAAEVRNHGDVFTPWDEPDAGTVLLNIAGEEHDDDGLRTFAADLPDGARTLVNAESGLVAVLSACLGAWFNGGSVVLVHAEEAITDRLLSSERVTA